jgi:hypothetical protein
VALARQVAPSGGRLGPKRLVPLLYTLCESVAQARWGASYWGLPSSVTEALELRLSSATWLCLNGNFRMVCHNLSFLRALLYGMSLTVIRSGQGNALVVLWCLVVFGDLPDLGVSSNCWDCQNPTDFCWLVLMTSVGYWPMAIVTARFSGVSHGRHPP